MRPVHSYNNNFWQVPTSGYLGLWRIKNFLLEIRPNLTDETLRNYDTPEKVRCQQPVFWAENTYKLTFNMFCPQYQLEVFRRKDVQTNLQVFYLKLSILLPFEKRSNQIPATSILGGKYVQTNLQYFSSTISARSF